MCCQDLNSQLVDKRARRQPTGGDDCFQSTSSQVEESGLAVRKDGSKLSAALVSSGPSSTIPFYQERLQKLLQDAENCDILHREESDFMSRLRSKALSKQQAEFDKAKFVHSEN